MTFFEKLFFMNDNVSAKQQNDNRNLAFYQIVCEKHDFTIVTQTTTQNVDGVTTEIKKTSWMQCRKCGKILNNEQRL